MPLCRISGCCCEWWWSENCLQKHCSLWHSEIAKVSEMYTMSEETCPGITSLVWLSWKRHRKPTWYIFIFACSIRVALSWQSLISKSGSADVPYCISLMQQACSCGLIPGWGDFFPGIVIAYALRLYFLQTDCRCLPFHGAHNTYIRNEGIEDTQLWKKICNANVL